MSGITTMCSSLVVLVTADLAVMRGFTGVVGARVVEVVLVDGAG